MSAQLKFTTFNVFTKTPPSGGNPLAIVQLPSTATLTQAQKQLITRESNFSEAVFLHEPSSDAGSAITIDIFTTTAGCHSLATPQWARLGVEDRHPEDQSIALESSGKVRVRVPIDFKIHASYQHPTLKSSQPQLLDTDYANGYAGAEAVVSIVKGMTFILLPVTSERALSMMRPFSDSLALPAGHLGQWDGLVGVYAFFECGDGTVRTRMFHGALEDPATGSAASALAGWLGTRKGPGRLRVNVVQGVEMGRRSDIGVVAVVDSDGGVLSVDLEGEAARVMEGFVLVK